MVVLNLAIVLAVVVGVEGPPSLSSSSSTSTEPSTSTKASISTTTKTPSPRRVVQHRSNPVVVVLGAEPGVGDAGWVQGLAEAAAERERTVDYAELDPADPTRYLDETTSGAGKKLTLRNGSVAGASLSYAANRAQFLIPREADVVLMSFSPKDEADVRPGLKALRAAARKQAPGAVLALVVPPRPAAGTGGSVLGEQRSWAKSADVPVIDVDEAFRDASGTELRADWLPTGLSEAGASLWATTVVDALLGADSTDNSSSTSTTTVPTESTSTVIPETLEPEPTTTSPAPATEAPVAPPTSNYVPPTFVPPTYVPPTYVPPSTTDAPTESPTTSSTEPSPSSSTSSETGTQTETGPGNSSVRELLP